MEVLGDLGKGYFSEAIGVGWRKTVEEKKMQSV